MNYDNSKYGVKLQYPSDWPYTEANSNPSYTSLSPQIIVGFKPLKVLQQPPYLGLAVMNLPPGKITLDQFATLLLNNLRQSKPNLQLIGSNSTTLFSSNQAHELVYTAGGEKTLTLFTIIADKVYIIYYKAPRGTSQYMTYVSTAQKVINSIEFLNTTATTTSAATNQTGLNSTIPNARATAQGPDQTGSAYKTIG